MPLSESPKTQNEGDNWIPEPKCPLFFKRVNSRIVINVTYDSCSRIKKSSSLWFMTLSASMQLHDAT